jgi:hypothetical protein
MRDALAIPSVGRADKGRVQMATQREDVLLREFGITRRDFFRRGGVAGGILVASIPVIGTLYPRKAQSAERTPARRTRRDR